MKLLLLVLLSTVNNAVFAQSQTLSQPIRTESNGVKVYEATGNEGPVVTIEPKTVVSKTINDWSLLECQDALYFIDLKIEEIKGSNIDIDQIELYEQQKLQIIARKQFLISNN